MRPLMTSLTYTAAGRGETTPRHLRIYANHSTIVDFEEAEDAVPHLNISLSEGEVGVVEYPLRASALCKSVGGESVQIFYVTEEEGTQKLEIRAANAPDARIIDRLAEKSGGMQTTAR
ncbi:hypothetical protein BC629DRAFT_1549017 [Irpex lacteus]|nr:hypothetical protein BC629DRAFT_1549017 [Irpex lacteus]